MLGDHMYAALPNIDGNPHKMGRGSAGEDTAPHMYVVLPHMNGHPAGGLALAANSTRTMCRKRFGNDAHRSLCIISTH